MYLMSSKALALGKWLLPSITFLEIYQSEHADFKKINCANDFKNSFSLTKILSNYNNKQVIFVHSLEEGNCCTRSTVNTKESDKFYTKSLKEINLAFEKQKPTNTSYCLYFLDSFWPHMHQWPSDLF